jgi:3-hydroxyacyl-CoA dehydrogenase/3-hydroxy-2-methylbutyryl-CoA dehydrogenase
MELTGRTALVTGGASGLGRATVERLHAQGMNVVVADRADAGEEVARALGARAHFEKVDIASAEDVQRAVDAAASRFGGLHAAVSCAGIGGAARVLGKNGPADLDAFARVVHVNLVGTFNVLRLCAARMALNAPDENGERGVVVNTASIAAFDGQMGQAAYAASKGGIVSLTLPAARDLAKTGIRVVAIAPGIFETPMLASVPDDVRRALGESVPFPPRLGRPSEFAMLAEQVLRNPMLNGEVIRLDGALRMAPK